MEELRYWLATLNAAERWFPRILSRVSSAGCACGRRKALGQVRVRVAPSRRAGVLTCPVLCVVEVDTVDEAIALANDSDYTLSAALWTKDVHQALQLAGRIRSGRLISTRYSGILK
jgi:hypothetical protein